MAYIPPHKRHSMESERPLPTPELLSMQFKRNLNFRSSRYNVERTGKKIYFDPAITRWFAVGLSENKRFPSYVNLEPLSIESFERKQGKKPLVLVNSDLAKGINKVEGDLSTMPWVYIADNVLDSLISYFENVRNMENQKDKEAKTKLVARIGKLLFLGNPALSQELGENSLADESKLREVRRILYTNVPDSYMKRIVEDVSPIIGVEFEGEKDMYCVKLSDALRPDAIIICKCRVGKENQKLQLYKIELDSVRHAVNDISCLTKSLDFRLALYTKGILTALTDDEMQSIRDLIDSAVIDPEVKGGLRWPLGKASGDRFNVVGIGHTISKVYKSPSLRLKVRHADRFDFKTSTGEITRDVSVNLKAIVSELRVQDAAIDLISDMLKENLRLIWNHFLSSEDAVK